MVPLRIHIILSVETPISILQLFFNHICSPAYKLKLSFTLSSYHVIYFLNMLIPCNCPQNLISSERHFHSEDRHRALFQSAETYLTKSYAMTSLLFPEPHSLLQTDPIIHHSLLNSVLSSPESLTDSIPVFPQNIYS